MSRWALAPVSSSDEPLGASPGFLICASLCDNSNFPWYFGETDASAYRLSFVRGHNFKMLRERLEVYQYRAHGRPADTTVPIAVV
jgi:hypothetical protein